MEASTKTSRVEDFAATQPTLRIPKFQAAELGFLVSRIPSSLAKRDGSRGRLYRHNRQDNTPPTAASQGGGRAQTKTWLGGRQAPRFSDRQDLVPARLPSPSRQNAGSDRPVKPGLFGPKCLQDRREGADVWQLLQGPF